MLSARHAIVALPRLGAALSLAALFACGGGIEPTGSSGSSGASGSSSSSGSASEPVPPGRFDHPPSNGSGPTQPVLGPALPPPKKLGDPPGDGAIPFHLAIVSNLSKQAGAVGVTVSIDGTNVVTGGFAPGVPHTFDFFLAEGGHELRIETALTPSTMPADEHLDLDVKGESWGIVKLSSVRCDPCSPATIGWELRDTPPAP